MISDLIYSSSYLLFNDEVAFICVSITSSLYSDFAEVTCDIIDLVSS